MVLENLKLGHFIDKFKEQNISPDIICKLSLQEFAMSGINNRLEIMALQIACSTYKEKPPAMLYSFCGAPQFLIPKNTLWSAGWTKTLPLQRYRGCCLFQRVQFIGECPNMGLVNYNLRISWIKS